MIRRLFQTALLLALTAGPAIAADRFAVTERTVPDYKTVAATYTTRDMGEARARIGGTIVELRVREGDLVTKDQVLAVVADQKLALELQSRAAQTAAAKAQSEQASADLGRVRAVFEKGFYSKARLDQAVAAAKSAEAAWKAAAAAQGVVAEQASQGKILAPAAGKVVRASTPAGSVVNAGDIVVVVASNDPVVRVEMPERDANGLKKGDALRLVADGPVQRAGSTVIREIYPEVRNGRVTIDLEGKTLGEAFIGQRVRVLVATGERRAIVIPQSYVMTRFGVDYVGLALKDGTLDIPVQRGQPLDVDGVTDGVEILSGLKAGDVIVKPEGRLVQL
ncbi:MAG: efflux RND transporter periplasmic adaptor subunit [Alphaproteobacteria bacterium]|nr:efflux RND transporter periplasmic adaptor subunit [Alphaproteobacteria bacterium]